ncbi:hypothetical protein FT663_05275 [Candidozyma haemuli var. vulneris]|uniref:Membrane insertase YidC/Oxa/ALB C-terminal domain-containing protein n=1 Tax=Candidozyma haemuli TaxID=45357 RepID=A0A2V1B012_9ASCO|nr:hypothetical protein CXQ85_003937 [[Candida] haemuloni]KAF3985501.1 hypothetical protein FT663_05275 [[Candida] haemuloni var. vulneris]KAF3987818.1 hypothetical protein FT662_03779 [[Candida] haemuloni var. vulneris]PVH23647.1 hypothetical protein CXQ85_003937 [[Candida] haemuloni]
MLRLAASKAAPVRSLLRLSPKHSSIQRPVSLITPLGLSSASLQRTSIRLNSQSTGSEIQDKLPSFDAESVSEATNLTSDSLGYLDSIGMAQGWGLTSWMETYLEYIHVYSGLPWWGTIVASALLLRVCLIPFYIKAAVNNAKMAVIQPQLSLLMEEMRADDSKRNIVLAERRALMKKHDVSLPKSMLALCQVPFAYGIFQGLRKMAAYPVEGFQNQGALWFQDLTQVDPYWGLQGISALFVMAMIRLGGEIGSSTQNPLMKKYFFVFPAITFVVTMNFSAAVALYIGVGTLFSVVQSLVFKTTAFRKFYNLPEPPKQDLSKSPKNLSEWFHQMADKQRVSAKSKMEQANRRLEAQHKKRHGRDGFVKRH